MIAQHFFDEAQEAYNSLIEKLSIITESLEKISDGEFKSDELLASFDRILQYMLLYGSISDNKISRVEQQFINLITDRGDIFKAVEEATGVSLTWDSIENLDIDKGMELLDALETTYTKDLLYFCATVARVDGMIEEIDLLALINDDILKIFSCFSLIDGNASDAETEILSNTYVRLFVKHYKRFVLNEENDD